MNDVPPITDPTLAAYHAPLTERERVYFAAMYTADGELRLTKVVEKAEVQSAELQIEGKDDDEEPS